MSRCIRTHFGTPSTYGDAFRKLAGAAVIEPADFRAFLAAVHSRASRKKAKSLSLCLVPTRVVRVTDHEDEVVRAAIQENEHLLGPLLPMAHAIQDALGFIPEGAVDALAHALNLSRAEVLGTLTFYHDFRFQKPGRHVVRVCRAEACQAVGGRALEAHVEQSLGVRFGETKGDVTLEEVFCFGNCACGPAVQIDGVLHGRVTEERFHALKKGWT